MSRKQAERRLREAFKGDDLAVLEKLTKKYRAIIRIAKRNPSKF
jgi:hypothetical protein